ncbi:MAG: hypothetical protein WBD06_15360 [Acidobacteriaceae bacterium]
MSQLPSPEGAGVENNVDAGSCANAAAFAAPGLPPDVRGVVDFPDELKVLNLPEMRGLAEVRGVADLADLLDVCDVLTVRDLANVREVDAAPDLPDLADVPEARNLAGAAGVGGGTDTRSARNAHWRSQAEVVRPAWAAARSRRRCSAAEKRVVIRRVRSAGAVFLQGLGAAGDVFRTVLASTFLNTGFFARSAFCRTREAALIFARAEERAAGFAVEGFGCTVRMAFVWMAGSAGAVTGWASTSLSSPAGFFRAGLFLLEESASSAVGAGAGRQVGAARATAGPSAGAGLGRSGGGVGSDGASGAAATGGSVEGATRRVCGLRRWRKLRIASS